MISATMNPRLMSYLLLPQKNSKICKTFFSNDIIDESLLSMNMFEPFLKAISSFCSVSNLSVEGKNKSLRVML